MAQKEVIDYVKRLRANGYSQQAILQNLIGAGYTYTEAQEAISGSGTEKMSLPSPKHHWKAIAAGSIGGAFIILLILFLIPSKASFTLRTAPISEEIIAGTTLKFTGFFTFENPPKGSISLEHDLISPETLNLVARAMQTTSPLTQLQSSILVPSDLAPGRYLLKTTATGGGIKKTAAFSIKVIQAKKIQTELEQTPELGKAEVSPETALEGREPSIACDDLDICTRDYVRDNACIYEKIPVCCGDYVCDFETGETTTTCPRDCASRPEAKRSEDIIAEAEQTAPTDPERASLMCRTLSQTSDADQCYDLVARASARSGICAEISNDKTRDSCYLFFAIRKDQYDVCSSIVDPTMQSSCYSFKNLHAIQQSQQQA